MLISDAETLYCHPESCAEHVSVLIQDWYIGSEIRDPERDAETEGPEFSSGSIQHDRKRKAQPPMLPCTVAARCRK